MTAYAYEWIDPAGAVRALQVEYDVPGLFAPPVVVDEDTVPDQPGSRIQSVRHGPREFPLPLYERNDSPAALHTQLRELVYAMDPTRGEGTLRVTTPVGDQRQLPCRVVAGLDLSQTLGRQATPTWQRAAAMFRAPAPYWLAVSDVVTDFAIGTAPATFFPIFPLRLAASEIAVDTTVTNGGDVDSWPVWTITGPGSGIVLRNLTTGYEITMAGVSLTAGETITIDTRPGAKTVTKGDGTNLWPAIASSSALWPLRRGANAVRLEMTGSTTASLLHLAYRPRYLTI